METIQMDIANFNLTFGNDHAPMLEYLEDYLWPAINMDFVRIKGDNKFSFSSLEIIETERGYALTGLLIVDTKLVIKSERDNDGKLVESNKSFPSSPYSYFCIFLKNHRMVFIKNQKGSPDLKSLGVTVRSFLSEYKKQENKRRKDNKLPSFNLNVIGIPTKKNVEEYLKTVNKIKKMRMRFYPLNGEDIDLDDLAIQKIMEIVTPRKFVGSNTGSLQFNSPENKENVGHLMSGLNGTVETTLEVEYFDGNKGKIKNSQVSEKISIDVDSEQIIDEIDVIVETAEELDLIKKESNENNKIYAKYLDRIKQLIPFK